MAIKAAIFDLDGTLLNTIDDLAAAGNALLKGYGYEPHPVQAYNTFVGDGVKTLVKRILPPETSDVELEGAVEKFRAIYSECWHRDTKQYTHISEMLEGLQKLKIRCCILSNKPHDFTIQCVEHFFIENSFEIVFGQRANVPKKPDPAGAFEIIDKLGMVPSDCIYVGDTAVDMQTGKSAGLFTIGVTWGFRDKEELIQHSADLIVDDPVEIARYVHSTF